VSGDGIVAKSCRTHFETPWTVTDPMDGLLSMELSRQEYWSGLPFPSPGVSQSIFCSSIWFLTLGFPGGLVSKESTCNAGRPRFSPWVGKIPWRRKWQPTPVFLPGEFHGQETVSPT